MSCALIGWFKTCEAAEQRRPTALTETRWRLEIKTYKKNNFVYTTLFSTDRLALQLSKQTIVIQISFTYMERDMSQKYS